MQKASDQMDLVIIRELLLANMIHLDTLSQLLIEQGLISEERFLCKLRQVQSEYKRKEGNA